MPQGDKRAYTAKQIRKARDIEHSYEDRGISEKESERRAWATVNKQDGGGLNERSRARNNTAKGASSRSGGNGLATAARRPVGKSVRTAPETREQRSE